MWPRPHGHRWCTPDNLLLVKTVVTLHNHLITPDQKSISKKDTCRSVCTQCMFYVHVLFASCFLYRNFSINKSHLSMQLLFSYNWKWNVLGTLWTTVLQRKHKGAGGLWVLCLFSTQICGKNVTTVIFMFSTWDQSLGHSTAVRKFGKSVRNRFKRLIPHTALLYLRLIFSNIPIWARETSWFDWMQTEA